MRLFNRLWYGTLAVAVVFGMGGCAPQDYQLKRIQCFTENGVLAVDSTFTVSSWNQAVRRWVRRFYVFGVYGPYSFLNTLRIL